MDQKLRLKYLQFETDRHGNQKVYFRKGRRQRVRLPDDTGSEGFQRAYRMALADLPVPDVRDIEPTKIELRKQKTEKKLKSALAGARARARAKGLEFDLDIDFLLELAEVQDFKCSLTGIEFFHKTDCRTNVDPCTPSIDRIEPELGYVKHNVRIILYAMNAMLLDWGEEIFIKIANSYRYTKSVRARK